MTAVKSEIPQDYNTLRNEYINTATTLIKKQEEIESLKKQLEWFKKQTFGSKTERLDVVDEQQNLFGDEKPSSELKAEKVSSYTRKVVKQAKPGKKPLPENLPRRRIVHEPEAKSCNCGCELKAFHEDCHEELNFIPASFEVIEHVYPKYSCPKCHDGVYQAKAAPRPIEKGRPSASLLSYVHVSKYQDHIPLDRLCHQFNRFDVDIPVSTLNYWVKQGSNLLEVIYHEIKKGIVSGNYVLSDDTKIKVQMEGKNKKCHQGYVWVYGDKHQVFYHYTKGRSREGPDEILKDFKGYLQTDGYAGYNQVAGRENVTQIGCMSHVRRMFFDLRDTEEPKVTPILNTMKELYQVERQVKELDESNEVRLQYRNIHGRDIFSKLEDQVNALDGRILPKSELGKAIYYAKKQLPKVKHYFDDIRIEIDNNFSERCVKPFVIGRKNWMFFHNHNTAKRHMILFSIIESCKLAKINAYHYLTDVFARIQDHPAKKVSELTPLNWKKFQDGVN